MSKDTSTIGAISELRFVERCLSKGLFPFKPVVEHFPDYDFVVEIDETLFRVQVKTFRTREVGGYTGLSCGNLGKYSGRKAYDYMAAVSLDLNRIWLLPVEYVADRHSVSLSIDKLDEWSKYEF